jgi:hypothetical protein
MGLNTQEMARLGLTKIGESAPILVLFGIGGPSHLPETELRGRRIQPHVDRELGQRTWSAGLTIRYKLPQALDNFGVIVYSLLIYFKLYEYRIQQKRL